MRLIHNARTKTKALPRAAYSIDHPKIYVHKHKHNKEKCKYKYDQGDS